MSPSPVFKLDEFYEVESGMIMCGQCLHDWIFDTASGKLVGDERYTLDTTITKAETPAQCDNCLEQSDDYDDVLDDE